MEKKYRYRTVTERKATAEERQRAIKTEERVSQYDGSTYTILILENDDICSQVNTFLKMAQKRALMGAVQLVVSVGDIFDLSHEDEGPGGNRPAATRRAAVSGKGSNGSGKAGNGTDQRPTSLTIKTNAWISECQSLARDVPHYAKDDGKPDFYKIQAAVATLGITIVNGDNLLDIMDRLRVQANAGDGPPPEEPESVPA
jgi:hypothetical protein